MRKTLLFLLIYLSLLYSSCCFSIKEEYLGNNFYLSEFDIVDRRILYSEESCSGSGIQVVPMTVTEYAYNSEWIIAQSAHSDTLKYWIINKDFEIDLEKNKHKIVESNIFGPFDSLTFIDELKKNNINLILKKIQ